MFCGVYSLVFYVLLRVLDDLVDGCLRLEVLYDLMAIFARYVRCTMVTLVKRAGTCSLVLAVVTDFSYQVENASRILSETKPGCY